VVPALAVAALQVIIVPVDLAARLRAQRDLIALRQPLRLHARLGITVPLALSVRLLARLVTTALRVALRLSAAQQATLVLPVLPSVLFVVRVLTVTRL
jgi:cytochrome b561